VADEKAPTGPERHGWHLHAHPLFLDQLERLLAAVERAKRSDPQGWQGKADTRLLAALRALILDCESAWKSVPAYGVISVETGPTPGM